MTTKEPKKSFRGRLTAYQILLGLFIAVIIVRLFIIAVAQHGYYQALAEDQHGYFQKLVPNRGEIFITDKFSQQPYAVATNAVQNLAYAVPSEVKTPQLAADQLATILGLQAADILPKISDLKKQYVPLMHGLTDAQSSAVTAAKIAGIYLSPENVRYYPEGNFLSQVLGFIGYPATGDTKVGLYGIEKYFEKALAGTPGVISTETDFNGNWITGADRQFQPAKDGDSLLLTVDRSIQFKVESVLAATVQQHGADSGEVIVANPKTGAILAMATYPSFDPNNYSKASSPSVYQNLATTMNYEPGSTMKTLTMSAGLDMGLVTPDTTYNDTGEVQVDGFTIHNSDLLGHGTVDMRAVIDHSLNTGAIFVEGLLGNDNFLKYIKKFELGKATDVELPETVGDISQLKGNVQVNYDTASFGQGITVTPIQMLQAYMAVANGGKMMQPYIVDSEIAPDGKVTKTQPKQVAQVISQQAASMMTSLLVDDVENGYGKKAAIKGYYIAGKTGTAQVADKGGYAKNDNIGSFIGFAPADNPQFVILFNINHPRDVAFAENTTVPPFGEIAQFILNYYQIPPTRQ